MDSSSAACIRMAAGLEFLDTEDVQKKTSFYVVNNPFCFVG
jgi:hypothetical protein